MTPIEQVISRKNALADLASRNITTLEQLAALPLEQLQSVAGISETTAPRVKALAQAYLEDKAIRFAELAHENLEQGAFLDVRVDPDTRPQQPWGFCLATPDGTKHRCLVMPNLLPGRLHMDDGRVIYLVPDVKAAWKLIADIADECQSPVYYWSKNILGHINKTARKEARHRLLARIVDLSNIFLSVAAVPTKKDGLHDTATYLGYNAWGRDHEPYKAHIAYLGWLNDNQRIDLFNKAIDYLDHNVNAVAYVYQCLKG